MVTKKTNIFRMLLAIAATRAMKPMTTQESHVLPQAASSTQEQAPRTTVQDLLEPKITFCRWQIRDLELHKYCKENDPKSYTFYTGSLYGSMLLSSEDEKLKELEPPDPTTIWDSKKQCTVEFSDKNRGRHRKYIRGKIRFSLLDLESGSSPVELDLSLKVQNSEAKSEEFLQVELRNGTWRYALTCKLVSKEVLKALNEMGINLGWVFQGERWIVSYATRFCLKRISKINSEEKPPTWSVKDKSLYNYYYSDSESDSDWEDVIGADITISIRSIPGKKPWDPTTIWDLKKEHTLDLPKQNFKGPDCKIVERVTVKFRFGDLLWNPALMGRRIDLDLFLDLMSLGVSPLEDTAKGDAGHSSPSCEKNEAQKFIFRNRAWRWPDGEALIKKPAYKGSSSCDSDEEEKLSYDSDEEKKLYLEKWLDLEKWLEKLKIILIVEGEFGMPTWVAVSKTGFRLGRSQ